MTARLQSTEMLPKPQQKQLGSESPLNFPADFRLPAYAVKDGQKPTEFGDQWWEKARGPTTQQALQELAPGQRVKFAFASVDLLEGGMYRVSPSEDPHALSVSHLDSTGKWTRIEQPILLPPGSSIRPGNGASIELPARQLSALRSAESISIGRSSQNGFSIHSSQLSVSRMHLTLECTHDGTYRVGAISKNSPTESWHPQHGWQDLNVGDRINPGTKIRLARNYELEVAPQLVDGIPKERWVSIGRNGDILTAKGAHSVSDEHLTLRNAGSGYYEVMGEPRNRHQSYYQKANGEWALVTSGEFLAAGTKVRLGDNYTIQLGSTANREQFSALREARLLSDLRPPEDPSLPPNWQSVGISAGQRWTGPESGQVMQDLKHSGKYLKTDASPAISIYGETSWLQRWKLQTILSLYSRGTLGSQMPQITDVYVAKPGALGKIQGGSQSWNVKGIDVDLEGRLLITSEALKDKESIRNLFDALHERELTRRNHFSQIRTYTEGYVRRIAGEGRHVDSASPREPNPTSAQIADRRNLREQHPHGLYLTNEGEKMPVLGRGMENFNGSAYVCASIRPVMILDDRAHPELAESYEHFIKTSLTDFVHNGELSESSVLHAVCEYTNQRFAGPVADLEAEMQQHMREKYGAKTGGYSEIPLHEYLAAGKGVCTQNAVYAGYLMERLKADGLLNGSFSFERNKDLERKSGHAWIRYESQAGGITFVDPSMRQWPLSARDLTSENWPYLRSTDVANQRREPLGLQ